MSSQLEGAPVFTQAQWRTFYALASALIYDLPPSVLRSSSTVDDPTLDAFAAETADADNAPFRAGIEHAVSKRLSPAAIKGLGLVFNMLNSTAGSLLLTYGTTPFHRLSLRDREACLRSWLDPTATQLFPPIRGFAAGIRALVCSTWLKRCTAVLYPAIQYEDRVGCAESETFDDDFYRFKFEDLDATGEADVDAVVRLECDVVVVGSGCGGAVVAAKLAQGGLDVIVVEKGSWIPANQLPLSESDAQEQMFEGGMVMASADNSIAVLAGSTFGGGGVVNWCASLENYVRKEWAEEYRLPFFLSGDFQACLDRVSQRMGVGSEGIVHNHRNHVLLSGARALGYHAVAVPQNGTAAHQCGYCHNGCGGPAGARKMGTSHTFLPDAARAGARFLAPFDCAEVVFADEARTRAVGVAGAWGENLLPVRIDAKHVVVAAGSLNSPALLLRSGLKNPAIGANLYLHPTFMTYGLWPQSTASEQMHPMVGSPLTAAVCSLENLDGAGHGVKLEASSMTPTMSMALMPWAGAESWKKQLLAYPRMGTFISILREKHPGRVTIDGHGKPVIQYTPSREDRAMLLEGTLALAKMLYLAGAETIFAGVQGVPPFERNASVQLAAEEFADEEVAYGNDDDDDEEVELENPGILDPPFVAWCDKLEAAGLPCPGAGFGSAHQMSSCGMSGVRGDGVVDWRGRVKGVQGLWVADASVLPSACGVNPMVTTMAVADWIGGHIKEAVLEKR